MKRVLTFLFLTVVFVCCTQKSNVGKKNRYILEDSTDINGVNRIDSASVTIYEASYVLSLQGNRQELKTLEQLSKALNEGYNKLDTLYVFIDDTDSQKIKDILGTILKSNIAKFRFVVKDEFFKLPYPDKY